MNHLTKAIGLDPSFAAAYAYRGFGHFLRGWAKLADDIESELSLALEEARRAVEIDPRSAMGHGVMSMVWSFQRDWARARGAAMRALSLNPRMAVAHMSIGVSLLYSGDPKAALYPLTRATQLEPFGLASTACLDATAAALYLTGEYQSATTGARKAIARRNGYIFGRAMLVASLARQDRLDDARSELDAMRRIMPEFNLASFNQPFQPDQLQDVAVGLRLAGLSE